MALDLPGVEQAEAMIARLGDSVTFYKIGYQLAYAGGLSLVGPLTASGKKVFVDLKLHDIGNTVARGVESLSSLGATFLTVHAYPQTMQAAVEARGSSGPKILAVTVLTSYNEADLQTPVTGTPSPISSRPARIRPRRSASTGSYARRRKRRACAGSSATR